MSEKPILFNTEMVRAILDGRKSCTRRLVKQNQFIGLPDKGKNRNSEEYVGTKTGMFKPYCDMTDAELIMASYKAPYQPGDILYVRETVWQKVGHYLDIDGETKTIWLNEFRYVSTDKEPYVGWNYSWGKRPSIHMPKAAARIWLRVTNVKVERLQEITEDGAKSEGAIDSRGFILSPDNEYNRMHTAREHFTEIWNSTIKKSDLDRYGWDANPWVWVIEFDRCEKPGKR